MKPVIVDANLLLLLVVGSAGTQYIAQVKSTQRYDVYHFDILITVLKTHAKIIVTPHSLTEVWNLIGEKKADWDQRHDSYLASAFKIVAQAVEVHTPASDLVRSKEIAYLGLSDVAQITAAKLHNGLLLSSDGKLCHAAQLQGVEAQFFWTLDDRLA